MFPQSKHLFAKLQAHPPQRPEETDEVGRVIQFQMSSPERLFEKLMTHPKVDEAHSNAPLSSPKLKRSPELKRSSAPTLMVKLVYLWGFQHNPKGMKKQQGNSGARKSVARPKIKQRRILPRAECMNRITMADVSEVNKRKGD